MYIYIMSQGATPDSSYSPPSLSFPPLKFSPAQKIAVKFLYLTSKSIHRCNSRRGWGRGCNLRCPAGGAADIRMSDEYLADIKRAEYRRPFGGPSNIIMHPHRVFVCFIQWTSGFQIAFPSSLIAVGTPARGR